MRTDENALWSFGPHDISVLNYLTGDEPVEVSARGECYLQDDVEDVVFGYIKYKSGVVGHLHVSWLDPHKSRKITVVGEKKMVVFDDMESERKITVYDKGATTTRTKFETYGEFVTLHFGDIHIPKIGNDEPLRLECQHFVDCIVRRRAAAQRRPRRAQRRQGARRHGGQPARGRPPGEDRGAVTVALHASDLGHNLLLGDGVVVGADVVFGANVVVYEDTVIGDGCFIQDGAVLGKVPSLSPTSTAKRGELAPLVLGPGCVISTGAVAYRGTDARPRLHPRRLRRRARALHAGREGRRRAQQRGRERHGDRRLHQDPDQRVHHRLHDDRGRAASSRPCVQTTNDNFMGRTEKRHKLIKGATIRRGARVGGGVVLCPAIEIGEEAFIAAGAVVTKDAPAAQGAHGRAGARRARRVRGRAAREPVGAASPTPSSPSRA